MSGILPPLSGENPVTRSHGRVQGVTPPLSISVVAPPSRAPHTSDSDASAPVVVESEDEEEYVERKDDVAPDSSDIDSESGVDDEEETLLRVQAELKAEEAELKKQRVAELRMDVERRAVRVAARKAERLVAASGDYLPAEPSAPVAMVTVNQTPAHSGLRPRRLGYDASAMSRIVPSAAVLAHKASINALPDVPAVQVTVTPTVVGSGRVVAPTVTTIGTVPPAPHAAVPAATRDVPPPNVERFSGDDMVQNGRVENWVDAINRWLSLSKIDSALHLDYALSHLPAGGSAYEWVQQRKDEVNEAGKQLTWTWLQSELIEHYAHSVNTAALQTEWQMLKMGVWDDSQDAGKGTRTVTAYTNRFLYFLRRLTTHSAQTTEVTVIDRYVRGIRKGYRALYDAMLAAQRAPSPRFATLQEAINAAQVAQGDLGIMQQTRATSAPSSAWNRRPRGNNGPTGEAMNNIQGEEGGEEGEGEESSSPTPSKAASRTAAKLFGFRFISSPNDGRYKLSEKEQKMLYDQRRCYRCYDRHPVGLLHPACQKPVMKTAPKPLK